MPTRCHLIAPLGLSPAVVTEFIWWLVHERSATVATAEVWVTTRQHVSILQQNLAALHDLLGERVPEKAIVQQFSHNGLPLDDVATVDDARLILESLAHQVARRANELPPEEPLVGLLSGGRKTMSASLMAAFSLHARARDPLFHVWLDPRFEASLKLASPGLAHFAFPEERWNHHLPPGLAHGLVCHEQPFVSHPHPTRATPIMRARWPDDQVAGISFRTRGPSGKRFEASCVGATAATIPVSRGTVELCCWLQAANGSVSFDTIRSGRTDKSIRAAVNRARGELHALGVDSVLPSVHGEEIRMERPDLLHLDDVKRCLSLPA